MTDIRIGIEQLPEPEKSLNKALIEFYQTMKGLENDPERGGKQATKIIMTCSDIQKIFSEHSALKEQEAVAWWCEKVGEETRIIYYKQAAELHKELGFTVTELVKNKSI